MGAKDNFNKATYELFGIGEEITETTIVKEEEQIIAPALERTVQPVVRSETSYIAPGCSFEGNIKTTGNVEISGEYVGDIEAEGKVVLHTATKGNVTANELELVDCTLTGDVQVNSRFVVSSKSIVNGGVFAKSMECGGKIVGDVVISGEINLRSTAEIKGNIKTSAMTMDRGAVVHGAIEMKEFA